MTLKITNGSRLLTGLQSIRKRWKPHLCQRQEVVEIPATLMTMRKSLFASLPQRNVPRNLQTFELTSVWQMIGWPARVYVQVCLCVWIYTYAWKKAMHGSSCVSSHGLCPHRSAPVCNVWPWSPPLAEKSQQKLAGGTISPSETSLLVHTGLTPFDAPPYPLTPLTSRIGHCGPCCGTWTLLTHSLLFLQGLVVAQEILLSWRA